jgi:hypothetical protein
MLSQKKKKTADIYINLERRQNNNMLSIINSFILLEKSLLYIFSHISYFFSILHITSFCSFDSKRIKFTYPPAIILWMFFFGRHDHFMLLLIIRHCPGLVNIYMYIYILHNGRKVSWSKQERKIESIGHFLIHRY